MGNKKYDVITFRGKYCEETIQIDRELAPNSPDRTGVIDDAFAEWGYWEGKARDKVKEEVVE